MLPAEGKTSMLLVNIDVIGFTRSARLVMRGRPVGIVPYVDDHWMLDIPANGRGMAPIVIYEGAREDAERVLAPIARAMEARDPERAFRIAKEIEESRTAEPSMAM